MATPWLGKAEEAQCNWERFSDEVGCDYVHVRAVAEQVCRGIKYLQEKGAAFIPMAFERDEDFGTSKIASSLYMVPYDFCF